MVFPVWVFPLKFRKKTNFSLIADLVFLLDLYFNSFFSFLSTQYLWLNKLRYNMAVKNLPSTPIFFLQPISFLSPSSLPTVTFYVLFCRLLSHTISLKKNHTFVLLPIPQFEFQKLKKIIFNLNCGEIIQWILVA